jgi:hypothetical protein
MADGGILNASLIPDYYGSVGFEMWKGTHLDIFDASIRVSDGFFISPHFVSLRQVLNAAGVEVAEWCD